MSVRLREFKLEEYDKVYRLWEMAGPGIGLSASDSRSEIAKKLERDPDLFLVAVQGDTIIGSVIGGFDGRRGIVYHLVVAQEWRGQGVGKALMEEVERRLRAKGCRRCYLLVKHDSPEVVEFYEKRGWSTFPVTILGKTIA